MAVAGARGCGTGRCAAGVAAMIVLLLPWTEGQETFTFGTLVGSMAVMLYLWWRWR